MTGAFSRRPSSETPDARGHLPDQSAARPPPIWRDVRPADIATLANAAIGLGAIAAAWDGEVVLAYHLVFLAIIVDGVDGAVARLGGGGGPLGHIIDTLADVVTFVAAPAAILVMTPDIGPWSIAAALAFLFAGLLRLARFQELAGTPHFFGLSTPGAAMLLGTVAVLADAWTLGPRLSIAAAAAGAVAMLMRRRVPKLRGPIGVLAALVIGANLGAYFATRAGRLDSGWHHAMLWTQLAFLLLYFAAGPAYLKARGRVAGH